jgi:hypothetical protein
MSAGPAQPNQISSFSTLSNLMTGPPNHYFIYSREHFLFSTQLEKITWTRIRELRANLLSIYVVYEYEVGKWEKGW